MKEETEIIEEKIEIPADMIVDVLAVILKEKLKYEIIQVIENRSLIVLAVSYHKNSIRHQHILNDILYMIEEYDNFRSRELDGVDWRGKPL